MKVLEHHQRRLDQLLHRSQRCARLARPVGLAGRPPILHAAQPLRDRPGVERLAVRFGQAGEERVDPLLLPGHEVDERVAGADEDVEFINETGQGRAGAWVGHVLPLCSGPAAGRRSPFSIPVSLRVARGVTHFVHSSQTAERTRFPIESRSVRAHMPRLQRVPYRTTPYWNPGAGLPEEARVNSAKNRKILVVEDSRLIHKMYEVMLQPTILLSAFNGQEGLDKLSQSPDVDFIILDINMPKMTGLEFLAQVKTTPALAKIPVIIVSTDGKEEDVARGLQSGAVAYFRKPFQREDLLKIVNRIESKQTAA